MYLSMLFLIFLMFSGRVICVWLIFMRICIGLDNWKIE